MKRRHRLGFLAAVILSSAGLYGEEFAGSGLAYSSSGEVVSGVWNTQYDMCVAKALREKAGLIAVYLSKSCSQCENLARALASAKVASWAKSRGYVLLLGLSGEKDESRVLALARKGTKFPFVGFYKGDRTGDGKLTSADCLWRGCGRSGYMPVTKGTHAQQFMESADAYLQGEGDAPSEQQFPMNITKTLVYGGFASSSASAVSGGLEVKIAKGGKVTADVQLPVSVQKPFALKKYKFSGALTADGSATLACSRHVGQMTLRVDQGVAVGAVEHDRVVYECRAETAAADSTAASVFKDRVWVLAMRTTARPETFLNGYSTLSVAANKSGKAKVSGTLADGTKVSVSVQGRVVDGALVVPVAAPLYKGKAGGFSLKLRLGLSGAVRVENASAWISLVNGARVVSDWGEIVGSGVSLKPDGAGLRFDEADFPSGVSPDTVFGEKLSYNAKTGLFKGSFQVLTAGGEKRKKLKATVNGAVVDGKGCGSAVIKDQGALPVTLR